MNISKTQWIIIAVLGAVAVWYFFLRKKDTNEESGLTAGTICSKKCYAGWGWYCCGGTEAQKGQTATATN